MNMSVDTTAEHFRTCRIPMVTLNEDESCWADAVIFALFYPRPIRERVLGLIRSTNKFELIEYSKNLEALYSTSVHNEGAACPKIPAGREFLNQILAVPGVGENFLLKDVLPATGGFTTKAVFDAIVLMEEQMAIQMTPLDYCVAIENFVPYHPASMRGMGSGFDKDGVYVFEPPPYRSKSTDLPAILILKHHNRYPLEDMRHTTLDVRHVDGTSEYEYVLRSVVIEIRGPPAHATALASCDPTSVTPLSDTKWVFFDGQSLDFYAHGSYGTFAGHFLTSRRVHDRKWQVSFEGFSINLFDREDNRGYMLYVRV